ncbi:MAG: hypothetical protein ACXACO_21765 [Promethearchaeota archaeon]|jgi:hypothetical protein
MNKKEKYHIDLSKIIRLYLEVNDERNLVDYFINKSNLPGRRANLELAEAFTDIVGEADENSFRKLWNLCLFLIDFSPDKAPVNSPKEFLPFCGTWAIGTIGASYPEYYLDSLNILKRLSNDPRWRMREAVAFGLQKLLMKHPQKTLIELKMWIDNGNWLTSRAVVAGVAHPSVLIDNKITEIALEIHEVIFSKIISSRELSSDEFKILKKGLSYTLSVIVQANPENGFKFLNKYIISDNKQVQMIIKENLKKNRLVKNFPIEVASLRQKVN